MDEVFFKAAGRNWAMTGRWAAPEIIGFLGKGPPLTEVYFAQPPLYTFLYGVYTKLVGFGPRSCILYDVLIHLLFLWSAVALARTVYALPWSLSALCGALLMPLGTVGRPDELGILLAMWGAVVFRSKMRRRLRAVIGGALLGLCGATSLGALVFLGPLVMWELRSEGDRWGDVARSLGLAGMGAVASATACVGPILASYPTAYQQLITHAQGAALGFVTGHGQYPEHHLLKIWAGVLRYGYNYCFLMMGLLAFAALCWWFDRSRGWGKYARVVLAALSLLLLVSVMPRNYFYIWFPVSWLFVACAAAGAEVYRSASHARRRILLAFASLVCLGASLPYLHSKLVLWSLPADQSLTTNWKRLRSQIPAGAGVVSTEYWWMLADRDRVYDEAFSDPGIDAVDYIVRSGNGTGKPGKPVDVPLPYQYAGFRPVQNHLNPQPVSFLGFPISRSGYGFGAYVLEKKNPAQRAEQDPVSVGQSRP
jgi:hypothetical protein